ncbi:MAG: winged helix-turn-helix domain-containing protein [Methanolobus sp.]
MMHPQQTCKINPKKLDKIEESIRKLQADMQLFQEQSNQRCYELLSSEIRNNFSRAMIGNIRERIDQDLESNIIPCCEMRDFCKGAFTEFLNETVQLVGRERVEQETVDEYWNKLDDIRKLVHFDDCDLCFKEVSRIYQKQVDVLSSLRIYDKEGSFAENMPDVSMETVVDDICEPLANKQRLTILKALILDSKSFTELSKLTGLRGGNLLFHLQKLADKGMILQRSERGDYIITSKGHSVFKGIMEIYSSVDNKDHECAMVNEIAENTA